MGKNSIRVIAALAFCALAAGCAGKFDYARPAIVPSERESIKVVGRSLDDVLNASLPSLSRHFSVIDNVDRSSGLISISYKGDPERYIDCGHITSYVMDLRGERTYDFPASRAWQSYEAMLPSMGLLKIDRKMSLEGQVHLAFEQFGPDRTRVTAKTRYVVHLQINRKNASNIIPETLSDTISFDSGGSSSFPPLSDGRAVECVATGALEWEILSFIR